MELDDHYKHKVAEWNLVQDHFRLAMNTSYDGMVSTVDVEKSYQEHKKCLEDEGYAFGTYKHDRSYFERLDRCLFRKIPVDHMGRAVFFEAKHLLTAINNGSKPEKNSFSMLVMMDTKYIVPIANMIHLLTHTSASSDDLDLFWELTDRVWCIAHPIYQLHNGDLDATCNRITKRLCEVMGPRAFWCRLE